jgi:membrane protein implicated in regulation of membrane protease activity
MTVGMMWLIAVAVFLVLEGITYQLVSIYLAVGAIGGMVTYLLGFGVGAQTAVFVVISALLLAVLRPVSMKLVKKEKLKTNVDGLVGKKVYITKEVNNLEGSGEGKVNGALWSVKSADDTIIKKDTAAVIERIEGVKLVVKGE